MASRVRPEPASLSTEPVTDEQRRILNHGPAHIPGQHDFEYYERLLAGMPDSVRHRRTK